MALSELTIDLDPIAEKAFELTKIKENYDLKEKINALRLGVFKNKLKQILNMTKMIFEMYDKMANFSINPLGNTVHLVFLQKMKEVIAGDDNASVGLKKIIGSFLYRKEITSGKIDEHAMSQFLVISTNLIAQEVREAKGLNITGISKGYETYSDLESIKTEILEHASERLN